MSFRRFLPLGILLLGLVLGPAAHADTFTHSGNFTADNSTYIYNFAVASPQTYTFSTTSYAGGGFLPDLTLFKADGSFVAFSDASGLGDVSFSQSLLSGSYLLYLTEFPNEAVGPTLAQGFLFQDSPTITGDVCGVSGGTFLGSSSDPCVQRTSAYAVNVSSVSPVPEPSTLLLVFPPVAALVAYTRRRRLTV